MSKNPAIVRTSKALLITGFVLLGSLLAAPLAASNHESHPTGNALAPLASAPFDHIVTILMENQGLCDVYVGCGGSAAYMSQFANQNVLVMTWGTTSHPSEGNYISLIGGDNFGHTNDGYCCWGINAPNIVDRMESAGLTWKAFAEDASGSGTCSFNPPRGADHFAFLTFADMNTPARCANLLTTTSSSDTEFLNSLNSATPANFIWLTPNDCNNMHDCGIAAGDSYLSKLVPQILSSKEFTTTKATLLIVFDEGYTGCSNTGGTGECVYASFSGPVAKKGLQLSPPGASHYSYLSTIEAAWGLASLTSNDAGAPNLLSAFGAICTTNCPLATSFAFLPANPSVNSLVTFTAVTTGGILPYTVSWNFGDGGSGTGPIVTHTYTSAQSFTITETAKDSSTPTQTATSSQSVTIFAMPQLSTTFQASSSSPQVGQAVTFTESATGGTSPYAYTLTFGDGGTGTGDPVTYAYSSPGSYTATVTVTDSASPQASVSASMTLNVQALIPPTLTVPGNQTVTAGTWINVTVTASSVNIGGTIILSATGLPAGASFDPTTGLLSWKPSTSQTGSYAIIFTASDSSYPSTPTSKPMEIQVNQAAPGGSNGGNGGSGGGSNGSCALCGIFPKISTSIGIFVVGGLLGLVSALAVLTIRTRASLERTRRRLGN